MTPVQIAERKKLDAAIAAAPDEVEGYGRRAHFLARSGGDFDAIVADEAQSVRLGAQRSRQTRPLWQIRERMIGGAKGYWRTPGAIATIMGRDHARARSVAYFVVVLELSPELETWRAGRPADWNAAYFLEEVAATVLNPLPPHWIAGRAADWMAWAWAIALGVTRGMSSASWAYRQALLVAVGARIRQIPASFCARRARRLTRENYIRLALWDMAIEHEPDNPRWHAGRGQFLRRENNFRAATKSLTRAIALAPDQPYFYETRAKMRDVGQWWGREESASHDYAQALRLRIAAGQIAGSPEYLAAQGARLSQERQLQRGLRAHAFYSLALEAQPQADWFLARAQVLLSHCIDPGLALMNLGLPSEFELAHADLLCALALDATLHQARAEVVKYLIQTLARPTAHEQIEALLEARGQMRDFGLNADLAGAILGEVETALA